MVFKTMKTENGFVNKMKYNDCANEINDHIQYNDYIHEFLYFNSIFL